ncbi:MAG TPA: lytic transglycosylase domain-containing protein [Bacteroidales bacterium]|nr:lytic transglycosylase domain-containing protein [Bacteroidales bacterium]
MKRKGGKLSWYIISPVLLFSALMVVFLSGKQKGIGGVTDTVIPEPGEKDYYAIYPVSVPDSLYLFGERVPLELFDVHESLDRELLSNTFFHSQTIRLIKLANRYFPMIEPIIEANGLPDDLKYLAIAESGLQQAVSPAGAVGFWQITRGTAGDYGLEVSGDVDERYHIEKSTEVACQYIQESFEKYEDWTLAAASYNVGRRGIDRQIARQNVHNYYDMLLNQETARYIFRIIAFKLIFENPADYGFHISNKDLYYPVSYEIVEVDTGVKDFADFAEAHGTNYKMLKFLNPWLRDNSLANSRNRTYQIKIPKENARLRVEG